MNTSGEGPAGRLLALIGEHRTAVRAALDDEQYALLLARLEALAAVVPDDGMAVRKACQGIRLALLALPFDHPVRAALDAVRLVAAPPEPSVVMGARELMALMAPAPPPDTPDGTPDDILRAPALSRDEAHARCGERRRPN